MASLFQPVNYGVINTYDTTTNVFYVIQFISEVYTLNNNNKINWEIVSAGELVVKAPIIESL